MLNRVTLVGRITRDLELKRIEGSQASVVNFTIALDRRFGDNETDFIPCTAWNKIAENMAKYLAKGSLIALDGRVQSRTYKAQDGTNRTVIEVIADNVQFLDSKGTGQARQSKPAAPRASAPAAPTVNLNKELGTSTTIDVTNDDLPW